MQYHKGAQSFIGDYEVAYQRLLVESRAAEQRQATAATPKPAGKPNAL